MLKKLLKILPAIIAVLIIAFTIFWFARPVDVSFEDLKAGVPHAEYSKFAEINGVKIHYQEKGEGTPLILIHGYASSTYSWKDVFEPLSEKYRVIAIDLKGFGFSEKPDGDYTRRAQGEIINGLLEYLKIEKAWIAGNSMGGETALNIALFHPEKVLGLILIDSAGVKILGRESLAPWYLQTPVVGQVLTSLALTSDFLVREGLKKSFYDDSKISDERVNYYYQPLKTRNGQLAAREARMQYVLYPVEDKLDKIKVPTLLIWGAEDELIPLEAGKKMNSLIKDSKLVVFESCGHIPQEEVPEKVLSEMVNFIEQTGN